MDTETMDGWAETEVRLYDELGRPVGRIAAPLNAEPIGVGRETVYMLRANTLRVAPPSAVAASATLAMARGRDGQSEAWRRPAGALRRPAEARNGRSLGT